MNINNSYYFDYSSNASRFNTPTTTNPSNRYSDSSNTPISKVGGKSDDKMKVGPAECQTCRERKYQDVSNDPGVSFKSPGHIDPSASASAVMSHEMEHVTNETAKARKENREVVSQSVSLQTAVCPECGKAYVSGGETTTVIRTRNKNSSSLENQSQELMNKYFGTKIDTRV